MLLQSNFAKRYVSNAENTPPSVKSTVSRLHSTLHDAARRRRARTNGAPRSSKYNIEQAKRRSQTKPAASLKFTVAPAPVVRDIQMKDPEPAASSSGPEITLPKRLGRPQYSEVSKDALSSADPELGDVDLSFIREELEKFGPEMLRGLASVKAAPAKDTLPKELTIMMQDLSASPPSHMLAIYGPPTPSAPRRKVTLYPVHSVIFSAYCSKLPPFPPAFSKPTSPTGSSQTHTVPVRPMCLPSPSTYLRLAAFLYTKRADALFSSLMPSNTLPSASLVSSLCSPSNDDVLTYSTALAGTYTPQSLLQHALVVHGLWQNVCALGIFEDNLWDVLDSAWRVLLTAIAVSTGNVHAMMEQED